MKRLTSITLALGACGLAAGAVLYHEPFDYSAADLTSNNGGTGWSTAWTDSGNPAVVSASGLSYTDPAGRIFTVSGRSANTADGGAVTTISLRDFGGGMLNNVWVSFLYQLPASNSKFEGVSFYRGTQQVFTVSNPSTTATASIYLTQNLFANNGVNTGHGVFGKTHLIVLKLTKGGGASGADRIEAFIDPILTVAPTTPAATVDGMNFDFNRVRLAGQDGHSLIVDEIRVGTTWEDVSPHVSPPDLDTDLDGLADSQEVSLGLDPNVSNAALIAALRANAGWFSLHAPAEISDMSVGGLNILQDVPGNPGYTFSLRDRSGIPTEFVDRSLATPPANRFLRLKIQSP